MLGKFSLKNSFHGRHVLNRYSDGMEKCIGCELCAGVCPARCIYVRGADNPPDDPVSPGERFGFVYEINMLRCIFCAMCVEACPTQAITESKLFEFSFTNRTDAIYTKDELLVDDDGLIRDSLSMAFLSRGCDLKAVESAEKGIEVLKNEHFDIIISDFKLTGISLGNSATTDKDGRFTLRSLKSGEVQLLAVAGEQGDGIDHVVQGIVNQGIHGNDEIEGSAIGIQHVAGAKINAFRQ